MIPVPRLNLDWQDDAACRGIGVDAFFYEDMERGRSKRARETAAKKVCSGCGVREKCLDFAIKTNDEYAILGGMTPDERKILIAKIRIKNSNLSIKEE